MAIKKLFYDTNILMDLFDNKRSLHKEAVTLTFIAQSNNVQLVCSTKSVLDFYYLQKSNTKARKMVATLCSYFKLVDTSAKALEKALKDESFKDFEDGVQHEIAIENKVDIILTNDRKGFKNSKIPIKSARQVLEMLAPR